MMSPGMNVLLFYCTRATAVVPSVAGIAEIPNIEPLSKGVNAYATVTAAACPVPLVSAVAHEVSLLHGVPLTAVVSVRFCDLSHDDDAVICVFVEL